MAATQLVLCASPRAGGRCDAACARAVELLGAAHGAGAVARLDVARLRVAPCTGCDACLEDGVCAIRDDMGSVLDALDAAAALYVASPVYFAGPPAAYKALLDRLQCRFWAYARARGGEGQIERKRPLRLLVVGEGGDPNGYDPLVTCTRSAFAVAGFGLAGVTAAIGPDAVPDVPAWLGTGGAR